MLKVKSLTAALFLVMLASLVFSSEPNDNQRFFKFAPSPKSQAKFYGITEFGYFHTISRGNDYFKFEKGSNMMSGNIGAMYNLSDKFSVGASFYTNIGELNSRLGLAPRVRYWINENFSSDFQLGRSISDFGDKISNKPSYLISASINYRNWISFTTMVEKGTFTRSDPVFQSGQLVNYITREVDQTNWYGGLKLNSYFGLGGIVAVPVYMFLFLLVEGND